MTAMGRERKVRFHGSRTKSSQSASGHNRPFERSGECPLSTHCSHCPTASCPPRETIDGVDAPSRPWCARVGISKFPYEEASMGEVSTIGLDLAKHVFQLHGADAAGRAVFRKQLRRGELLRFLGSLEPCVVAMEACGSAHYWAREIGRLGHEVRLIAPAYVKPFVKRQKNDTADAEAICEAAQRPSMRFVAVKSEARQAAALVFRTRDLLVRQRTQAINALRSRHSRGRPRDAKTAQEG